MKINLLEIFKTKEKCSFNDLMFEVFNSIEFLEGLELITVDRNEEGKVQYIYITELGKECFNKLLKTEK